MSRDRDYASKDERERERERERILTGSRVQSRKDKGQDEGRNPDLAQG